MNLFISDKWGICWFNRPNSKDFEDEPPAVQNTWELDYGKKLSTLVQLTGYSDPIYAETFV